MDIGWLFFGRREDYEHRSRWAMKKTGITGQVFQLSADEAAGVTACLSNSGGTICTNASE